MFIDKRNKEPFAESPIARRWFLQQCGVGLGSVALSSLFGSTASAKVMDPLAAREPHFAPKAKNVIFLFMAGAPSHLEMLDYKPALQKYDGTLPPASLLKDYRAAFINPNSRLLGPCFDFKQHGESGAWVSELLPHFSEIVDDVTIINGMKTDAFNHAPAQILMNTGSQQFGRPSMGPGPVMAWAVRIVIYRPSSSLALAAKDRAAVLRIGVVAIYRRYTRVSCSDQVVTRYCIYRIPRALMMRCNGTRWIP